jgi:rubredoxin
MDDTGATDAGSAYVYDMASGTPATPIATLNNPTPAAYDGFGQSVAALGTYVMVGGEWAGSVCVYDMASGTPTTPIVTLDSPGPHHDSTFGYALAVRDTYLVVGATKDSAGGPYGGCAYVFDLASGTPTTPIATLYNSAPSSDDWFGNSVAASGNYVVVGAYMDDTAAYNAGCVYVYDLSSGTPTTPIVTLDDPAATSSDYFGWSVAVSGTYVVVGAYRDDTGASGAGRAYVFDLSSGTPTTPIVTLNNPAPAELDHFGFSVAVSGTYVVVGADDDDAGATNAGSAYVYDLTSGTPTTPIVTLNNPAPALNDSSAIPSRCRARVSLWARVGTTQGPRLPAARMSTT